MNSSTAWTADRKPWTSLGFHVTCAGASSVDFKYVFLTDKSLPKVDALPGESSGITNPEYSYTDQQRITPFWKSNIIYNEALTMEQSGSDISGNKGHQPHRMAQRLQNTLLLRGRAAGQKGKRLLYKRLSLLGRIAALPFSRRIILCR